MQAGKDEVRLAVDLYNRVGQERQLEAFIVHMSIGWLKLLQARYEQQGRSRDLYQLDNRGRRQRTRQSDWLMKPLSTLLAETYQPNDPVRLNVEFFLGLRHKIEHRYDRDIASLVVGKTQAFVLNTERELVACFGAGEGLARELRIPVFLSSLTEDAVEVLKSLRARAPRPVLDYVQDYDAALDPDVASTDAYDFRVYLIPKAGPKTEADVAMTFVRLDELDGEQRDQVEKALTIIREKQVPVSNLDTLLPSQVVERLRESLGPFTQSDHTRCWQHYEVRPAGDSDHPERSKPQFCRWDATFKRYVYTVAWVEYLTRKLADSETHREVLGRERVERTSTVQLASTEQ